MTDELLADAAALEAKGEWEAAIELLTAANRAERSTEVEVALAGLRHRSYAALVAEGPGTGLVAPADPPPVGPAGVPEARVDGLDAATVRGAVVGHGSLLLRGAVDADRAAALADGIDRSFAAQDEWGATPPGEARPRSPWWYPLDVDGPAAVSLGRKWVRGGGGTLLADSPRLLFEVLDLYASLGLRDVVADYLGTRPVLSANKCTLRRVSLDAVGSWHQDGAFLGTDIRAINLWLTLSPCGVDAPGMDLVPRRFESVIETGTGGAYFDWAVGEDVVTEVTTGVGVVRPRFEAGDLLVFDHLYLHRTAVEAGMTRERHAIELWCFAADAYPEGQVPVVW